MKSERIRQARRERKITQEALGKRIGVTKATISQWESGINEPNGKNLFNLANALNVNAKWLLDGVSDDTKEIHQDMEPNAKILGSFDPWDASTPLERDEIDVPFFKEIELAAGSGRMIDIDHNGYKLRFARSTLRRSGIVPENAACVSVTGNSMAPVLPNGAVVGVDMGNKNVIDGKIYAIEHAGMLRVKILYRIPGGLRIRSYNKDEYADEDYTGEKADEIRIIGWVFWYSVML